MNYIWQHKNWPQFNWNSERLLKPLGDVRFSQGALTAQIRELGFEVQQTARADVLVQEALKTSAIEGETHEYKNMYPDMIEAAKEEGDKAAERSFSYANTVEEIHAGLYAKVLESLESPEECNYYVCSVCGYTCENEAPEQCPVCGSKAQAFSKID